MKKLLMLQGLLSKHMVETLSQNIIIATVLKKDEEHKLQCYQGCHELIEQFSKRGLQMATPS